MNRFILKRNKLKNKKVGIYYIFLVLFICFIIGGIKVSGESIDELGFTVDPILPDNQINKEVGYYNLLLVPDESQKVSVRLKSTKKEPVIIKTEITNAWTNRYGQIDYGKNKKIDKSLNIPLTEIVTIDDEFKEIILTNFEEKIITFNVNPPKKSFTGIKLGAISFFEKSSEQGKMNQFGYRVGILLNEDKKPTVQAGVLELLDVEAGLDEGFLSINLNFVNKKPYIIKDLDFQVEIRKLGDDKVIESYTLENVNIAPNSEFNMKIPWDINKINFGRYDVKVDARNVSARWEWETELNVKETEELEKAGYTNYEKSSNFISIIYGVIIVVIILNLLFIFIYTK